MQKMSGYVVVKHSLSMLHKCLKVQRRQDMFKNFEFKSCSFKKPFPRVSDTRGLISKNRRNVC